MNNLQIEYFLALAEYKNFTETAKSLYVSQPAISKQISALEKEMGYALFFRTNRDVSLTPAGIVLLRAFKQAKDIYEGALQEIKGMQCEKSSQLRLGCVEGMELSTLLNKIFNLFRSSFPNVDYYLERHTPKKLIKALQNDDLDAIITIESFLETDPSFCSSVFLKQKHRLYVSAAHPAFNKETYCIEDFKDEVLIAMSPEDVPAKYPIFEWCRENGLTPKKIINVPNIESQTISVEAGLGVTIADSLNTLYNDPSLRSIELKTSHNIVIAWKKHSANLLIPSFVKLASEINNI